MHNHYTLTPSSGYSILMIVLKSRDIFSFWVSETYWQHEEQRIKTILKYRVGMRDIIYEIQCVILFMKYNIDIIYREDIASYTRKNREKSI